MNINYISKILLEIKNVKIQKCLKTGKKSIETYVKDLSIKLYI